VGLKHQHALLHSFFYYALDNLIVRTVDLSRRAAHLRWEVDISEKNTCTSDLWVAT